MNVRDHRASDRLTDWGPRANSFQPLTQRDDDWRLGPMARVRPARTWAERKPPSYWRSHFERLGIWWDEHRWMPATIEDTKAAYFLLGQLWMGGCLLGAWLLIHFI